MGDPLGIPMPDRFRCGRCGNWLDGGTDAPVERAERDALRQTIRAALDALTTASGDPRPGTSIAHALLKDAVQ